MYSTHKNHYSPDGDGVFEVKNGGPIVRYTYSESGDFNVNVRATDANGRVDSHSVLAHVDTVAGLTVSLVSESETLLKWEVPVNPSGGWMTVFLKKTAAPAARERRIMVASLNVVKRMTGKSGQRLRRTVVNFTSRRASSQQIGCWLSTMMT